MPKNRKEHVKRQRINGLRQKALNAKREESRRNFETLQRAMSHSDEMRAKHPELFAAVLDCVGELAEASGIPKSQILRDGIVYVDDEGNKIAKSPGDLLQDIADNHPAFSPGMRPAERLKAIMANRPTATFTAAAESDLADAGRVNMDFLPAEPPA